MSARRLPVLKTAVQGWRLLVKDWSILLRIAWLPVGIMVGLDFLLADMWNKKLESSPYTNFEFDADRITVLTNLDTALVIVLAGLVVALWHRVRLTGPRVLSILGLFSAWRNIVALTAQWCGLILVTIGLTWVFNSLLGPPAANSLTWILTEKYGLVDYPALYRVLMDLMLHGGPLFAALYIPGRLGLMLWARPAGGEGALDKAWAAGNGNGWRTAAAIFVAIAPVMIFESALQPIPGETNYSLHFYLWSDLSDILQLVVAAGVISATHRALLGGEDTGDATVPAGATKG